MALVKTAIKDDYLILSKKGMEDHRVPLTSKDSEIMSVSIWRDTVKSSLVGNESDIWLSNALGFLCHLVYMEDDTLRQCDVDYANKGDQTGFADVFPMLFISEASLSDLNTRLAESNQETVEMRRFRPNVVITGCDAFAEDTWKTFKLADIPMRGIKLCERCVLTTVDPDKGERTGNQPLMTLAKYRRIDNKVCFGMNVVHQEQGVLQVGDELKVSRVVERDNIKT